MCCTGYIFFVVAKTKLLLIASRSYIIEAELEVKSSTVQRKVKSDGYLAAVSIVFSRG